MHKQYHKETVVTNYAEHKANLCQQKYQQQMRMPQLKVQPSPLEIKAGEARA